MKKLLYLAVVCGLVNACSPGSVPSGSKEAYTEDISYLRPEYTEVEDSLFEGTVSNPENQINYAEIEPAFDVTKPLNTILDSIDRIRDDVKYINGFTILVYSGTNSEQARIARGKVYTILPNAEAELKYDEPSFRVKVGKYYSRIEAQKDYTALKEKFAKAIIIPERLYIN